MLVIVFILSFLLNFVWEMWQMPFFHFESENSYTAMNWMCTQASLGDGLISVLAFLVVKYRFNAPLWYRTATRWQYSIYLSVGILMTIVLEWINIYLLGRWYYADIMPVIPMINVGMVPLLQWLIVPLVLIFLLKRGERYLINN